MHFPVRDGLGPWTLRPVWSMAVVVKWTRDLTRVQLKEVKPMLDAEGYFEAKLQSAECKHVMAC